MMPDAKEKSREGQKWEKKPFPEGKNNTKGRIEKMSKEKNGENTDLECNLILLRNMDSEKG